MSDVNTTVLPDLIAGMRLWLQQGRVQADSGAYCAWRDAATGELAFEYPEITGYALTHLAGRPDRRDEEREAGERAASWLSRRLGVGDYSARAGWDEGAIYTFDLGMIAAGALRFGAVTDDDQLVELGVGVARRLADLALSGQGLRSIDPSGPASAGRPGWSTDGIPHLFKCVQSLLLAAEATGDDIFLEAGRSLYEETVRYQADDGRFRTEAADSVTMLHPHAYTIEGLYMWGTAREDGEALQRAERALEWAWAQQLETGGFPRFVAVDGDHGDAPEQGDLTAQTLRMASVLRPQVDGLGRAVSRLDEMSRADGELRAVVYQPASGQEHHNAWVTMFAIQALETQLRGGDLPWRDLV